MRGLARMHLPERQRGAALLILLVIVSMGVIFALVAGMNKSAGDQARARAQKTYAALAQAKEALIVDAATDNNRPGSLPCPDFDDGTVNPLNTANDGIADVYTGNECPGYVAGSNVYLGRLPWRTLGLPDLRDSSGERLWYAVSRDFARKSCSSCLLNSDTLGQLTVTGIAPVNNVVAIIFAPGTTLGAQARDAASQNTASNYLEGENANGNNPIFTTQASSTTFNDQLLTITNGDLMPAVERRVARAMISILQQYKAATAASTQASLRPGIGVYPWADRSDGGSNDWNHNRFPCGNALPVNWSPPLPASPTMVPNSVPPTSTPVLPAWLTNGCTNPVTGWTSVIYYGVARNKLATTSCSNCTDNTLTVTNPSNRIADLCPTTGTTCSSTAVSNGSADLILITPGAATAYPRCGSPPCWPTGDFSPITGYFEDAENSDNSDDIYVVPSSTDYNRDRIYIVR